MFQFAEPKNVFTVEPNIKFILVNVFDKKADLTKPELDLKLQKHLNDAFCH